MCPNYFTPLFLPRAVIDFWGKVAYPSGGGWRGDALKDPTVETLVLVPSERCNLSCTYCYEQQKSSNRMEVSTAKRMVEAAFAKLSPSSVLKIEFRGGEPFLEFDFIKEVCGWVIDQYPVGRYSFYAITNGTCFSDKSKTWLQAHKEVFTVPLSLDGARETQNRNRSNSFDLIDFGFLLRTWARPCCITTILPDNVSSIFEDLKSVMDMGFDVRVNFGYTQEWSLSQLEQLVRGFKRFADYALEQQCANRINLLSRHGFLDYSPVLVDRDESSRRRCFLACNAGKHRSLVAADGKVYPCQAFVPSAFDWASNMVTGDMFKRLRVDDVHPAKCCKCRFFYLCHICPGFSYGHARSFKWRNPSLCSITRIRAFLASYYWGLRIWNDKQGLVMSEDEIRKTTSAIVSLYRGERVYG